MVCPLSPSERHTFPASQVVVVAQVGIHVRVLQVAAEMVQGVCVHVCFVGHAATASVVMLFTVGHVLLPACPRPPHAGFGSQLGLPP